MKNKLFLPIGMFFQFTFTVGGGGLLIAGLISGFSMNWDLAGDDNKCRIALVMAIFGGIFFVVGVLIMVFIYKAMVMLGKEAAEEREREQDQIDSEHMGES